MMAFVGAARPDLAEQVLAAQHEAMARNDDIAGFTRDVGHAVTRLCRRSAMNDTTRSWS